ncbi:PAS domain-containing protein [Microbacterium sp.]|uniref:helix-turn-helix transcriptional regulator n=1 Tax=Microbacterium sp. TaxID=51671 RepID=UPI0025D7ADDC|nr:PAS domain-containing protein [Microbacterium sp.]
MNTSASALDGELADARAPRRTLDGERLITVFSRLVEPIGRALPTSSEVVLHDLSLLPNSIVAVFGDVTGRRAGDPATDLLLEQAVTGFAEHDLGYETVLSDGRRMRSSTMIIRDVAGNPVAALCINTDVSAWMAIKQIADVMVSVAGVKEGDRPIALPPTTEPKEMFVRDVDELASYLIYQTITGVGIPVSQMKKEHKLQVVAKLKARGLFLLREAVEMIAESLEVSRFTIYNYLNELAGSDESDKSPEK